MSSSAAGIRKFEPEYAAFVNGSDSGVEHEAVSIVNCVWPVIVTMLHSDPAIVILLPVVQFGLK